MSMRTPLHALGEWPTARRAARPVAALALTATAMSVRRDLRRARTVVRLPPPVTTIDERVRPRARAPCAPELALAALGDSSIAGVGAERVADCLAVQIGQRLADRTGRVVRVRGYGVSGARTADVADAQVPALDRTSPPDAVVVVVGANDIVHVTPPWQYQHDLTRLLAALRARVHVPIVLCSLPEVRAISLVGHPLRDVAIAYGRMLDVIQRRAVRDAAGVTLVDARRQAGPVFLRRPDAMAEDGFHPSGVGYALLAGSLAPAVAEVVTRRRPAERD